MDRWRLKQFRSISGREAISDWRRSLSPGRRAVMNTFLKRIIRMESWPTGTCNPIKGQSGKWELRWTAEKVQHRIFGYYDRDSFVMLVGCTHKGRIYDPHSAFETLKDRFGKLFQEEGDICDFTI
jgi:hypothetical protein